MKLKEEFISASVNSRSHCLAACQTEPFVIFASSLQIAVETIPSNEHEIGVITSLSEKRHSKSITTLKRVKSSRKEIFITGGMDSRVVLWQFSSKSKNVEYLNNFNECSGSVASVCGCETGKKSNIFASWVDENGNSGLQVWWLNENYQKEIDFNIELEQKAFALCLDVTSFDEETILLAVGTSKRFVELFGEAENQKSFNRLISVAGHTDWIHSLAFNDIPSNLLLASAGQDTFVRLWSIERNEEENGEAEEEAELTSSKNNFTIKSATGQVSMKISSNSVMQGHDDWIHSTTWNSEGTALLTASSDKTCIIWKEIDNLWRDDVRLGLVGGQSDAFYAAVFSSNNSEIIVSSYFGSLRGWKIDENYWKTLIMSSGHSGEVRDVDWQTGPDGQSNFLISVGKDQTTRVYAKYQKQNVFVEVSRPQVHGHDMQCVAFINNSPLFVSGAEEKVLRAFRAPKSFVSSIESIILKEGVEIFGNTKIAEFGACVPALGLSNKPMSEGETVDGEHWEEDAFRAAPTIFDAPPTENALQQNTLWPEEHKLYGHGYEIYSVASNPNGTVVASACKSSHAEHSKIILWKVSDWSKQAEIQGHQLTVTQIAWNSTGTLLLSVSRDRTAKLYREKNGNVDGFDYECFWSSAKQHSRIIWACDWFEQSDKFVTASRDQKIIVWKVTENVAAPITSLKLDEPVTAVAASLNFIAAGLQSGQILIIRLDEEEQLKIVESIEKSPITIDAAVLRLRFSNKNSNETLLAAATTDAKLRVLKLTK